MVNTQYKKISAAAVILILSLIFGACSFENYAESGTLIIRASDAVKKAASGYVFVDAQSAAQYSEEHIENAVNIERDAIMIKDPVDTMLATAAMVAKSAGAAGLTEETDIVIYDNNLNMDASRLWWTLKIWGHKGDIVIVSGGLTALKNEGFSISHEKTAAAEAVYRTSPRNDAMISVKDDILAEIDDPTDNYVLIDVRSDAEYISGSIPGALHINHEKNMFVNNELGTTFRPISHIRILYRERSITPDDEIVLFCKSSVRAANTYAALYNAGYRNIKLYDGAYLEWAGEDQPEIKTEVQVRTTSDYSDNS